MSKNFIAIKEELDSAGASLIAVSKTKPNEAIMELYQAGQRAFGENRVQELVQKYESLPKDISWHLIGHLQKNKVKYIAGFVDTIQSIDSIELLKIVNKKAQENDRNINVLLQIKIAQEDSKYGFEMAKLVNQLDPKLYKNVKFCGVMGMATFTDDQAQVRSEFERLNKYHSRLKEELFDSYPGFRTISMGMSGDYKIAIEEGSTMVRIGSLLFGTRNNN